jgi:hypothetical protein
MKKYIILALLLFSSSALAGTATVTWVAPTTREDGTAMSLSEIASYKIYYGNAPGTYTTYITVPGSLTTAQITLGAGSWYFAATTVDTSGLESAYSGEATKTILKSKPRSPSGLTIK